MADFLKNLFGGTQSHAAPITTDDAGFADFAGAPDPVPESSPVIRTIAAAPTIDSAFNANTPIGNRPYTKWYRVWERTTAEDFKGEAFILPFIVVAILIHLWGTRANRRKAKAWANVHIPVLQQEFASVGFGGRRTPTVEEVQAEGALKAEDSAFVPEEVLKEKSAFEWITYCTGRQNVAFVDIKISLLKRYNPLALFGEKAVSFIFESVATPMERMEAVLMAFDGKERDLVPIPGGRSGKEVLEFRESQKNAPKEKSEYDGFVWAIVHKDVMKRLRDERYDLSLTGTKDHPKLPVWCTVMSEAAEITETLLSKELVDAVAKCGEGAFESLIVTDQPQDQPKKLDETIPRKRISLTTHLPSNDSYTNTLPLFTTFLRLPDFLVANAHFRPEVLRRVRQTREEEIRKIVRVEETEKAEERKLMGDKQKKEARDKLLGRLSAEEQRKYLEKERERDMRKGQKKRTMKG